VELNDERYLMNSVRKNREAHFVKNNRYLPWIVVIIV